MYRHRYMIVEYNRSDALNLSFGDDGFKNVFPLHEIVGSYHFQHLDDNHVIAVAEIPHNKAQQIERMENVSVLPHNSSTKAIHKVVKKESHWNALRLSLQLPDEPATMGDILDDIEKVHGPVFGVLR